MVGQRELAWGNGDAVPQRLSEQADRAASARRRLQTLWMTSGNRRTGYPLCTASWPRSVALVLAIP